MKIAICLSGQARTIRHTWPSLYKNLISLADCDVFIHSSTEYKVPEDFWRLVAPKVYKIEPQCPIADDNIAPFYFHPIILHDYLQQIYGYKRVWQLKEEYNTDYDLVIRTRPDVEYLCPMPMNYDLSKMNGVPRILDPDHNQCFTDAFFAGSEPIMDRVMQIFDWVSDCVLQVNDPWTSRLPKENAVHTAGKHSPESLLMTFMEQSSIPFCYTDFYFEDRLKVRRIYEYGDI